MYFHEVRNPEFNLPLKIYSYNITKFFYINV